MGKRLDFLVKKFMMLQALYAILKRSIVLLVSAISIAAACIFVVLHHSEKSLEFAGVEIGRVDASGMDVSFLACNPSIVPITVEGVEANLGDISGSSGSLVIVGNVIPPLAQIPLQGRLDFTDFGAMKTFVDLILNNDTNADFNATLVVKAKLLGVVPYSYTEDFNSTEFSSLVFGNEKWDCQAKQDNANNIRQQLVLTQARMSTTSLLYLDKVGMANNTNYTKSSPPLP